MVATAVVTYRLDIDMRANRARRIDLAEIRDIRYGLLNATVWAERIAPIFSKKIAAFDLTVSNKEAMASIDSEDVSAAIVYQLQWRECR